MKYRPGWLGGQAISSLVDGSGAMISPAQFRLSDTHRVPEFRMSNPHLERTQVREYEGTF
jgi:hypothetical protein